jgi:hypothetical protein
MTKTEGRLLIALAAVLIQLTLAGTGMAEVVDRIVAVVNNEIITMSELQNMAKTVEAQSGVKPKGPDEKKMQREMLEALIDRKLAKAEAKRRGITVTDKEVQEALTRFKQRSNIPNDEVFAKGLAQAGLSFKEFKQQLEDQMVQERLMVVVAGAKVTINDAEVRRIYDQDPKGVLRCLQPFGSFRRATRNKKGSRKRSHLEGGSRCESFAAANSLRFGCGVCLGRRTRGWATSWTSEAEEVARCDHDIQLIQVLVYRSTKPPSEGWPRKFAEYCISRRWKSIFPSGSRPCGRRPTSRSCYRSER